MHLRVNDIFKFIRVMLIILAAVVFLSACSSEKESASAVSSGIEGEESDLDEQQRSCWQGEILADFYNAMGRASLKAYPKVTKSAMPFMMAAFAVWLSIRLLKHLSSVVEESPAEVWSEIARMAFICLTCGILASSTSFLLFVLNYFVFPVYYAFLEYGSLVLNSMSTNQSFNSAGIYLGNETDGFCLVYTNSLVCQAPTPSIIAMEGAQTQFPSGPSEMMQCLSCAISDRLQIGFTLSTFLMKMSTFSAGVCGLLLYIISALVKISFVFYMVDSIFRMSIMVILLPCFILAYPFKYTRKWTKEGFLAIINSAAVLAFMAILVAMALMALQLIIIENADLFGTREYYSDFGIMPLSLLLIGFLILKSCSIAVTLAGSIVGGGGGTKFQEKIAKLAAVVGKKIFSAITGGFGKIVAENPTVQRMKEMQKKMRDRVNKMAGRS